MPLWLDTYRLSWSWEAQTVHLLFQCVLGVPLKLCLWGQRSRHSFPSIHSAPISVHSCMCVNTCPSCSPAFLFEKRETNDTAYSKPRTTGFPNFPFASFAMIQRPLVAGFDLRLRTNYLQSARQHGFLFSRSCQQFYSACALMRLWAVSSHQGTNARTWLSCPRLSY